MFLLSLPATYKNSETNVETLTGYLGITMFLVNQLVFQTFYGMFFWDRTDVVFMYI